MIQSQYLVVDGLKNMTGIDQSEHSIARHMSVLTNENTALYVI